MQQQQLAASAAAPSMAEYGFLELPPTYSVETFDGSNFGADLGNNYVFSIDKRLLIDPCCLKLGAMIGEGPYSIVYEGLYDSKPVAVKVIQPDKTEAVCRDHKEKFEREVTLLSSAKHENVVKFIGASVEPTMMIVTEIMRGGTLQKYLWSVRPKCLDLKLALSFALDISHAMEYLHSNGIIHRDLKPCNILLTEDKKRIKLADFGLAREEISDGMTSEAGTYRWMAPEIFSCEPLPVGTKKHYDHKVDVYSFSIVLWELLVNRTPFKGRNNVLVAYAASKNTRPSMDNIPNDIIPLLESCWAEDPTRRPEFFKISSSLTNVLHNLCSTQITPSKVVQIDCCKSNMKEDTVDTRNVMQKSENNCKKKRKNSLNSMFWCFDVCICD